MSRVPKRDWFWVTQNVHTGPLSARPWSSVLRKFFRCQFTETWSVTDFFSYISQALFLRSTSQAHPQDLMIQVGPAAGKLILVWAFMWTWLKMCFSLNHIWDHLYCSTYEVVSRSFCRAENGKKLVGWLSWNVSTKTEDFFLHQHLIFDSESEDRGNKLCKGLDWYPGWDIISRFTPGKLR